MLKYSILSVFLFFLLLADLSVYGVDKIRCSTADVFRKNAINHPEAIQRKVQLENDIRQLLKQKSANREDGIQSVITIPVVVHVIFGNETENISNDQIQSQIERLNKDFRNLNTDKLLSSHPFFSLTADAGIEFCLAGIDPNGSATTGITRTATYATEFTDNDEMKFTTSGGASAWDATKYLNIWVCNLSNDLLGYAQFPSELNGNPQTDGVVIGYKYFGTTGTVVTPYDFGRTATHEIGHWLNLEHIWGDENDCEGSDNVFDTPNQKVETTGCPSGVVTDNCSLVSPGIMYQNYMDYTDDACMVMFTKGQAERMNAVFDIIRSGIKTSNKCSGTTGVSLQANNSLKVYPNPVQNYLTVEGLPKTKSRMFTIDIFNVLGKKVYTTEITGDALIEMADFKTGTYIFTVYNEEFTATQKLSVVK